MRPKGKRMLAWLLATTVTLSGNSFTVLADELDFTDVQEVHEEETTEEQAAQDENATAEIQIQDDFQSEEIAPRNRSGRSGRTTDRGNRRIRNHGRRSG